MATPIIGDLIQNTVGKVVDGLVGKYLPDTAKQAEFRAEALRLAADVTSGAEAELTKRHVSDMASDSWLSKNIRPMVLIYLMAAWTVFAGVSVRWSVGPEFVDMLKAMLTAAFGFYFVSRGAEKIVQILKGK